MHVGPEDKVFEEVAKKQAMVTMNEQVGKWYGWASPVGLGIFLAIVTIALAVLIVAIRYAMIVK